MSTSTKLAPGSSCLISFITFAFEAASNFSSVTLKEVWTASFFSYDNRGYHIKRSVVTSTASWDAAEAPVPATGAGPAITTSLIFNLIYQLNGKIRFKQNFLTFNADTNDEASSKFNFAISSTIFSIFGSRLAACSFLAAALTEKRRWHLFALHHQKINPKSKS